MTLCTTKIFYYSLQTRDKVYNLKIYTGMNNKCQLRIILMTIISLSTFVGYGQLRTFSNFATPEVSTLFSFSEIPLNHSTGLPNVNVPLFTINEGALSVPIALSYHAGTIKPSTQPGWVGLGWGLSTDACITRTVITIPDDNYSKGWAKNKNKNIVYNDEIGFTVDGCSDIYHYSFFGHSGKFIIKEDVDNSILVYPYDDVIVKLIIDEEDNFGDYDGIVLTDDPVYESTAGGPQVGTVSTFIGFKIITNDGTTYEFREKSCSLPGGTRSYETGSEPKTYFVDTWYLSKITAANGIDVINFEYNKPARPNKYHIIAEKNSTILHAQDLFSNDFVALNTYYNANINELVYLNRITTTSNNTEVIFNKSERNDLLYNYNIDVPEFQPIGDNNYKGYKLDNIEIKTQGVFFKKFNFTYNSASKLKLTSIYESLADITIKKPATVFEYSPKVMNYNSSKDHWGFYNGNIEPKFADPAIKIGDRRPLKEAIYQDVFPDILTKVTFPTGGYTQFTYEPHTYSVVADDHSAQLKLLKSDSCYRRGADYYYIEANPETENKIITVTEQTPVFLRLRFISPKVDGPDVACYCRDQGCIFELSLMPGTNYPLNQLISMALGETICNEPDCCGQYMVDTDGLLASAELFYFYYEDTDEAYTGGCRVKSIKTYDPVSQSSIIKNYKYTLYNGLSSGVISSMPKYLTSSVVNYFKTVCVTQGGNQRCDDIAGSGTVRCYGALPVSSISYTGGSHILYSQVTEEMNNGAKTIYKFTTFDDFPDVYSSQDVNDVSRDYSHKRGLLKRIDQYENGNINAKYSKEIKYQSDFRPSFTGIKMKIFGQYNSTQPDGYTSSVFYSFIPYNYIPECYRPYEIVEMLDGIQSKTELAYDNEYINTVTSEKKVDIGGDYKSTTKIFPFDITFGVYPDMVEKNMIANPIEEIVRKNAGIISSQLLTYKQNGNDFVPDERYVLATTTPLSSITSYNGTTIKDSHYGNDPEESYLYDNTKGNIIQVTSKDGITTGLLWDNTQTYMMAKVEGVSYSTISSLDYQNCDYDSKVLWGQLKALAPQAIITTYSHKPLCGVTSTTDQTGLKTTYDYDSFGRLITVKNNKGEILNHYEYHYKQ